MSLYHTQPGDVVVVDARGDLTSGVFGEMMIDLLQGQGRRRRGDRRLHPRLQPNAQAARAGLWLRGVTPNFHTQTNMMPFAVNVPIACGGVMVMPGDIIVADDDGAVVVPIELRRAGHRGAASTTNGRSFPASAWPKAATCAATTRCRTRRGRNTRRG